MSKYRRMSTTAECRGNEAPRTAGRERWRPHCPGVAVQFPGQGLGRPRPCGSSPTSPRRSCWFGSDRTCTSLQSPSRQHRVSVLAPWMLPKRGVKTEAAGAGGNLTAVPSELSSVVAMGCSRRVGKPKGWPPFYSKWAPIIAPMTTEFTVLPQ
jgi:hypothetical protein